MFTSGVCYQRGGISCVVSQTAAAARCRRRWLRCRSLCLSLLRLPLSADQPASHPLRGLLHVMTLNWRPSYHLVTMTRLSAVAQADAVAPRRPQAHLSEGSGRFARSADLLDLTAPVMFDSRRCGIDGFRRSSDQRRPFV